MTQDQPPVASEDPNMLQWHTMTTLARTSHPSRMPCSLPMRVTSLLEINPSRIIIRNALERPASKPGGMPSAVGQNMANASSLFATSGSLTNCRAGRSIVPTSCRSPAVPAVLCVASQHAASSFSMVPAKTASCTAQNEKVACSAWGDQGTTMGLVTLA